jgi:SAM-dependent methyltransferase
MERAKARRSSKRALGQLYVERPYPNLQPAPPVFTIIDLRCKNGAERTDGCHTPPILRAMSTIREEIRRVELEQAWVWRSQRLDVLEIGGQSGLQARLLHEWGNRVTSVDIALADAESYFPITLYDGCRLPFRDRAFDVVYSSNVLEHVPVQTLRHLLAETARVLRPGGTAVHVLPSPMWRLVTMIAHYPWVILTVLGLRVREYAAKGAGAAGRAARFRRILRLAHKALIPPAHGVYPNAISELYFYSIARWRLRDGVVCSRRLDGTSKA